MRPRLLQVRTVKTPIRDTRIKRGQHLSHATEFKKGQHWRTRKPFWGHTWLFTEYVTKQRSAGDIAAQFNLSAESIHFWLRRHEIPRRNVSEARKIKHWGSVGEANPMFGKKGAAHPTWKGGLTPARQSLYASSAWRSAVCAVRKRDKCCRLCGDPGEYHIHHIDPFSDAFLLTADPGNLIRLCVACHFKIKGKEHRWKKRLFKLI